jgi:hypothetical protein
LHIRFVERAEYAPNQCAVTLSADGPFVDTGKNMDTIEGRVYVSMQGIRELIKASPIKDEIQAQLDERDTEIARLKSELAEADKFQEAAEYTLSRFGGKVQRKPGPRKKKPE